MKGHTKIILTNTDTGEVEVHEDNNLITNALDKLININVGIGHSLNTYLMPFATKALGGIMLFDGDLTEDPDNYHFPSEAHLVGYADRSTDSSDKFRGSFNAAESGKAMTGYVSVWDFGTSQANGTIKAVALTSVRAAACPLYQYNAPDYWRTYNGAPSTDFGWTPIRYDGEYVYMLKGDSNTHVMRLARVKIPMMGFGCADYSDVGRSYELLGSWSTLVTEYTWYGSQSDKDNNRNPQTQYVYADSPQYYEDGGDGYLYCVFYSPTRPYHAYPYNISYFRVRYDDGSYEREDTVRLSAAAGICQHPNDSASYMYCANRFLGHVYEGTLYCIAAGRKIIYKIPLANVAAYSAIRVVADNDPDYVTHLNMVRPHEGGVYFRLYHYTVTSWNYLDGFAYPDGVVVLPETSYAGQSDKANRYYGYGRTCDDDLTVWGHYDDDELTRLWTDNYLGTINNLPAAITKTPAQTMKIVYTLTDVPEGGEEGAG